MVNIFFLIVTEWFLRLRNQLVSWCSPLRVEEAGSGWQGHRSLGPKMEEQFFMHFELSFHQTEDQIDLLFTFAAVDMRTF